MFTWKCIIIIWTNWLLKIEKLLLILVCVAKPNENILFLYVRVKMLYSKIFETALYKFAYSLSFGEMKEEEVT